MGPTSGHWKCKARAIQNSGLKEKASLSEIKKKGTSKSKRESPVPLQELDLNIIELKCSKKGQCSTSRKEDIGNKDGGVAAAVMQHHRAIPDGADSHRYGKVKKTDPSLLVGDQSKRE